MTIILISVTKHHILLISSISLLADFTTCPHLVVKDGTMWRGEIEGHWLWSSMPSGLVVGVCTVGGGSSRVSFAGVVFAAVEFVG